MDDKITSRAFAIAADCERLGQDADKAIDRAYYQAAAADFRAGATQLHNRNVQHRASLDVRRGYEGETVADLDDVGRMVEKDAQPFRSYQLNPTGVPPTDKLKQKIARQMVENWNSGRTNRHDMTDEMLEEE